MTEPMPPASVTCELCDAALDWQDAFVADSAEEGDRLLYLCPDCAGEEQD